MTELLPPALAALRRLHPRLKVRIHTGLSGELAALLRNGGIDVAIATAPESQLEGITARTIVSEPLFAIVPSSAPDKPVAELLSGNPFIWFSRKTWAGQQIERLLLDEGLVVQGDMEVDSLGAVAALVSHGLGVSVVPHHPAAPPLPADIRMLPFGRPQATRELALLERPRNPKRRLTDALLDALSQAPHESHRG